MKRTKALFLGLILLVSILIGFPSCDKKEEFRPIQKEGVLDLRNMDFSKIPEPIHLEGEWRFHWKEFIISQPSGRMEEPIYIQTQRSWKGKDIGRDLLPINGYASYSLEILLPENAWQSKLGIKIPYIASSYRFFVNGDFLYQSGEPATTREASIPFIKNVYLPLNLEVNQDKLKLVFEVSNFENDNPGFWQVPKFGSMERIHKIQVFATAYDIFLFGALVVMGFYHWGIYFYHKSQKSILFFSFFSYLLALRVIVTGERYLLELFPFLDWVSLFRIEFLSLFLLPISFSIYMYYLFPNETKKSIVHSFSAITVFFLGFLVFPIHIFTMASNFFLFFIAIVSLYVLYINIQAVRNKREDSILFLLGLVILLSGAFWDVFQDYLNLRMVSLSPYGFLGFVFVQALVLSSRLALNFSRTESLSQSLRKSNTELTYLKMKLEERVEERTGKLKNTIELIRKDLEMAKNIQSKLIPQGSYSWDHLKIVTLYKPMEEVGGDIFDITEINGNKIRIFLADALGHGVQAALLTMAIKSEYEGIKYLSNGPADTIRNLSEGFLRKFSHLQTYFSCVVLDIDRINRNLTFASAGHPNQIILQGDSILELPRTAHIIGLNEVIDVHEVDYELEIGDRIYIYSDGAFEQFNAHKQLLGETALFSILKSYQDRPLEASLGSVERLIKDFTKSNRWQDDLTLIGIEVS